MLQCGVTLDPREQSLAARRVEVILPQREVCQRLVVPEDLAEERAGFNGERRVTQLQLACRASEMVGTGGVGE